MTKSQMWNIKFFEIQPVCFFFSQIVTLKKEKKKQTCKVYNLFDGLKYLLFEMVFIWLKASDKVKLFRLPWKFTKRNQCHGKNCLQIFVSLMSLVIDGRKSWKKLKSVLLYYLVLTTAQYEIFLWCIARKCKKFYSLHILYLL